MGDVHNSVRSECAAFGKAFISVGTEFGHRLFGKLYQAALAYVVRNTDGEGEMCLFDTTFAREVLKRPWPDGAVTAQISYEKVR